MFRANGQNFLLGSFLITLAIGSREIKWIDGAKHVEPMAEDWRTRVQLPPSPPIEEGELISVHLFLCLAPRCRPTLYKVRARVYGLRPLLNLGLSKANILWIAEYSLRLFPSRTAQVHDQRTESPLKSVAYYRTNQKVCWVNWLGERNINVIITKMIVVIILTRTKLSFKTTPY